MAADTVNLDFPPNLFAAWGQRGSFKPATTHALTLAASLLRTETTPILVIKKFTGMSSTELKLQIISKITSITDELILEEIYRLVNLESEMDSVYRLTDAERSAIVDGLKDVNEGRVYSSEAAENMIKEWLKK